VVQVKKRDMLLQVGLFILTLGLYYVYWFYQTAVEMKSLTKDEEAAPTLWTVLLFIPFGAIYSCYKYAEIFEKISTEKLSRWILFILWFVFNPAVWFIVQRDLNLIADRNAASPETV